MKYIDGGVCAAKGFKAGGIHCGIRRNREKLDLGLLLADNGCTAAGVFTRNRVKAAPVIYDMDIAASGHARAVIGNSGNANACAPDGYENAVRMAKKAAAECGVSPNETFVISTGVIGFRLNIDAIENGVPPLFKSISYDGSSQFNRSIMTTDRIEKTCAVEFTVGDKTVRLGGVCKGSGMIHPNMGTMLCVITTDADISADALSQALKAAVDLTFNRVSIDGDTSTNDTCLVLASGLAGNEKITSNCTDYTAFFDALTAVMHYLAREVARDGEGATKLITCAVKGAKNESDALILAKSVVSSSLTKAAMFGTDANWGRELCAMGYSGVEFEPEKVSIAFSSKAGYIDVYKTGMAQDLDEDAAKKILSEDEVVIEVTLPYGSGSAEAWGCDLTYDYVKINGDYRT